MIKNIRRIAALVLAASVCVAAGGCTNVKNETESDENVFVIGQLVSETGIYSEAGNGAYGGVLLAVNEINEAGGVTVGDKIYKLELIEIDDESNPDITKNGYERLKGKKINALIAPVADELCAEIEKTTNEDNMFTIIPSDTSDDTGIYDNTFKICLTNSQEGMEAAEHGFYNLNFRKGAVLYSEDEVQKAEAFVDEFCNCGGNIVAREIYSDDLQGIEANINSIKTSGAEFVYIPANSDVAEKILKTMSVNDIGISVIGSTQWDGIATNVYTGLGSVEYLEPYGDLSTEYKNMYEVTYGREANIYSAQGYDAVYVIKAAMEEAGNVDSDLQICAMDDINVNGATGQNISFTDDGFCKKTSEFKLLQTGG